MRMTPISMRMVIDSMPQEQSKTQATYRNRLDVIRNPNLNHMSRTKIRTERFKRKTGGEGGGTRRKKRLYDGAYVAEVRRQVESGFKIAGSLMKHIHQFVIDMDLTSLYPSIMILLNLSPKTFVAKLIFADRFTVPMYEYIQFLDAEEKKEYKCNPNDFAMECVVGMHWWAILEIFCKMKTSGEILDHIEDHIKEFQ